VIGDANSAEDACLWFADTLPVHTAGTRVARGQAQNRGLAKSQIAADDAATANKSLTMLGVAAAWLDPEAPLSWHKSGRPGDHEHPSSWLDGRMRVWPL
jgi:hypothetical protein